MKKFALLLLVSLLSLTALIGCTTQPTQVAGHITDINVPGSQITIQESLTGEQIVVDIPHDAGIFYQGRTCSLTDLVQIQSEIGLAVDLDCVITYSGEGSQVAILDVNIQKLAGITGALLTVDVGGRRIVTDEQGNNIAFDVPVGATILYGGQACSLEELAQIAADAAPGTTLNCSIFYNIDAQGNAVIVDVSKPQP
jgi:hypothetical protein